MKRYLMLSLLFSTCAFSAQIKTVNNYDDINVDASIKEPNSIMLDTDRILQIKAAGNTLVDACNGKLNCKLIDDATGIFTFLPSPLYQTRTFTINLITEKGFFYNVHVNPKPIPSQTILLKAWQKPVIKAHTPHTSNYEKTLVRVLKALATNELPEGFTQTMSAKTEVYRAKRTQLKRLYTLKGNGLKGEVFEIKNLTNRPLALKESWFNWSHTKAISLQAHHLKPFATTQLYRIS